MSLPMKPSDPAYWMLEQGLADPSKRSKSNVAKKPNCYICLDPEYALMGLPLCFACHICGSHVAADESECDTCGHDHSEGPDDLDARQANTWADDGGKPFESGPWLTDWADPWFKVVELS